MRVMQATYFEQFVPFFGKTGKRHEIGKKVG